MMRNWKLGVALAILFAVPLAWAGQVQNPIDAPASVSLDDIPVYLTTNAQTGLSAIHTANNSILATNGSGAPAWSTSLPTAVAVAFASLPTIASGDLYGNATGSAAAPADTTLTALIDQALGSAQGDILYRGASAWAALAPGTSGNFLKTNGAGASPSWASGAGGVCTTPGASTLGCVYSITSASHQWLSYLDTTGTFHQLQPAFTDLSGSIGAAQLIAPTTSAWGAIEAISCPSGKFIDVIPTTQVQPTCASPIAAANYQANPVESPSIVTQPSSLSAYSMAGLAGSITPAKTGNVLLLISGTIGTSSGTAGYGILFQPYYGTGNAPSNGASLTGTACGALQSYQNPSTLTAADVDFPVSTQCVVTGLTVGTAYWFDLAQKAIGSASKVGFTNISISAIEQ
jgi:hypothetical protein